jgi:hypothetical protein
MNDDRNRDRDTIYMLALEGTRDQLQSYLL